MDGVKLEYRDEFGRKLTQKEAFRQICYRFHGYGPGKKAKEKRLKVLHIGMSTAFIYLILFIQLPVLCLNSYLSIQLCAGQSLLSVYIIFYSVLVLHIIVSPFTCRIIATSSSTRIASYSYLSKFRNTLHTIFNFISVHHLSTLLSFLSYYRPSFLLP